MSKTVKQKKLKPRLVKGFRDVLGSTIQNRLRMISTIIQVYERYGFAPLETPILEYSDVLGKYLPDSDSAEEGVFSFRNPDDDEWISLRYDLTAPLSRFYAANRPDLPTPFRRYQIAPVCRYEKAGPGRYREFFQCDFDTVGATTMVADAEIGSILSDSFEALGIARTQYRIGYNNRKILNALMESAEIPLVGGKLIEVNSQPVEQSTIILRALDKLDRVGKDGVVDLLCVGRKDVSGDFTKGACCTDEQVAKFEKYLSLSVELSSRMAVLDELEKLIGDREIGIEGINELRTIDRLLRKTGYKEDRVVFDPLIVRGLGYYTGPVMEAQLTFEIKDEDRNLRQFGSVAGGGRYDGLIARFTGEKVPACGASIGVDRLLAALEALDRMPTGTDAPVLVSIMDKDRLEDYQEMVSELRQNGIAAELWTSGGNIKRQMKYADQRGCPAVVIQGSNEAEEQTISIKDLALGNRLSETIEDRDQWRKEQPAQQTVTRADLVKTIRQILSAGKED